MKTFREFLEEVDLIEMRKEDKVKGKKKTPLHITQVQGRLDRAPEGSGKKWVMNKIEIKKENPEAKIGRYKQTPPGKTGLYGAAPHPHGEGGIDRGKKKVRGSKETKRPRYGEPGWGHMSPAERVANRRARREQESRTGGSVYGRY